MVSVGSLSVPGVLNVYDEEESVRWGDPPGVATRRRRELRRYLTSHWSAPTVLVGEAPGKNGARWTGLPFTSMRQMTGEGPGEPTATIVQRVLAELGQQDQVLLWNASILFAPDTRNPRREELDACAKVLALICRGRRVLAVGRHAEMATGAPYIRHPSHGGSAQFAEGIRASLSSPPSREPWSGGARLGDVESKHPVGTLDVTMRSQPSRRRRDSPSLPGPACG
jgi:uracil-DNA glycosylase